MRAIKVLILALLTAAFFTVLGIKAVYAAKPTKPTDELEARVAALEARAPQPPSAEFRLLLSG